jgi:recombination protein RecR
MQLPSSLLQNAVAEFAKLPGIGKKTALRLVLHLLKQDVSEARQFGDASRGCGRILNSASAALM